ncbi:siderophore-interacting protein [Pseudoalteromonas piscicida]|uniref:Siderophore-interacting protein n=1 Tax=Pseudoalteromonas piscicida TaxID=43662 RepID=A0AAQ2EX96_PSEO7|nr:MULTISPECIES: siderophore-interacting protein [Pseudoalteromonas]KJY85280.1 Vibriobactin utilization protein ViuB [Pseudoalteromonas piscicida]TMN42081.1 siderophore-interacting protein [Pseudoalteromonas piscicida]TMN44539.1 siderophore-interacting protein [Pseudoalteromonas piscicida]TMN47771.1 siderophore-interacting protein [Pseudoalteromonas piscicida]TMN48545.1 siderophore-interacting protein [Pseudoalteromonas piscicida]
MKQRQPVPPSGPRRVFCVAKRYITPHLLRITVSGEALHGFPSGYDGAHIKLFFANRTTGTLSLPTRDDSGKIVWPTDRPVTRAYTVRAYRPDSNELDIDFVVHGSHSPASGWAVNADVGAELGVAGPGGPDPLLADADWHVLAGDLTAVPAISALLEGFEAERRAEVFIEIDSLDDKHTITAPSGVNIHWLLRQSGDCEQLARAIANVAIPSGVTSISAFIAGENGAVLACRKQLIQDFGLSKKQLYAIPYWRRGQDEETYHGRRHEIMDEVY